MNDLSEENPGLPETWGHPNGEVSLSVGALQLLGLPVPAGSELTITVSRTDCSSYTIGDPSGRGLGTDVSEIEDDFLTFCETGRLPMIFSDSQEFVASMLADGSTAETVVREHFAYRAARMKMCGFCREFIARVEEDERKRDDLARIETSRQYYGSVASGERKISKCLTIEEDAFIDSLRLNTVIRTDTPVPGAVVDALFDDLTTDADPKRVEATINIYHHIGDKRYGLLLDFFTDARAFIERSRTWQVLMALPTNFRDVFDAREVERKKAAKL